MPEPASATSSVEDPGIWWPAHLRPAPTRMEQIWHDRGRSSLVMPSDDPPQTGSTRSPLGRALNQQSNVTSKLNMTVGADEQVDKVKLTDPAPIARRTVIPALPLPSAGANKENLPAVGGGPPGMKRPDITTVTQVAQEAQQKSLAQRIRPRGLSRTLSMPSIVKSSPYRSISEELQQLRDNSLPIWKDKSPPAEESAELQRQLKDSLACIEDMKQELQSLRLAMSQQTLVDQNSPVKQRSLAASLDFMASTSTQGNETSHTEDDFPALPSINRSSTPLPRPDQPEAAKLFGPPTQDPHSFASRPAELFAPRVSLRVGSNLLGMPPAVDTGLPVLSRSLQSADDRNDYLAPMRNQISLDARSPTFVPQLSLGPGSGPVSSMWQPANIGEEASMYGDDRSRHSSADFGMCEEVEGQWMALVDRVVAHFDQHASVQLQQRLKTSPPEQRAVIFEAIHRRLVHLMTNRFGNFLVQRCFEHCSPDQIAGMGETICQNAIALSRDAFGCHVVQKALDNIPEQQKRYIVDVMSQDIGGTIMHRHSCHVWQKLIEIRWREPVPEFMGRINAELAGQWHDVAISETGSLVVQNIFENCSLDDAMPSRREVLANVDSIIRGQWGNWVIQHVLEHGAAADREHVVRIILANSIEYSTDQYASKVLEKAVKTGYPGLIGRYLQVITTLPPNNRGRPRLPIIDIASDQYGNYLINHILHIGDYEQRQLVANSVKKHMVSMRGSRYGARIAFAVERLKNDAPDGRAPGLGDSRGYDSGPPSFGPPPPPGQYMPRLSPGETIGMPPHPHNFGPPHGPAMARRGGRGYNGPPPPRYD